MPGGKLFDNTSGRLKNIQIQFKYAIFNRWLTYFNSKPAELSKIKISGIISYSTITHYKVLACQF